MRLIMRYPYFAVLLVSSLQIVYVSAAKCAAPPIALPYRNVSIAPGILVQGIEIQLGNPPQHVALTPSLMIDNTFIPKIRHALCTPTLQGNNTKRFVGRDEHNNNGNETEGLNGGENMGCAEIYGGGYDPTLSKSWKENRTSTQNMEPFLTRQNVTKWGYMDENFVFADYLEAYIDTIDALPEKRNLTTSFILPDNGTTFGSLGASPLGLTPNSTIISAMYGASMVPSMSWSLTNLTLYLGAIDDNAHTGTFQTFKLADRNGEEKLPCFLVANVESLYWYPKSGIEGTFLVREGFKACVDSGVKFLVLPDEARAGFEKATTRDIKAEYDDHIVLKGQPGNDVGILNFRLEGGMQVNVTIPGVGKIDDDKDNGEWEVPIGKGGWGAYGEAVPTLGKPFTDRVVIKWDADAQEYGIASVNEDSARKEDLKPFGCDEFPKKETVTASPATGTIVGAVVGGVIGGISIALAGLWFFQRGRKGVQTKYEPMRSQESLPMSMMVGDRRTLDSRMSGASSIRTTMSSQGTGTRVSGITVTSEPQLVEDTSIHEMPEGGTAYPTKRTRNELGIPSIYHR